MKQAAFCFFATMLIGCTSHPDSRAPSPGNITLSNISVRSETGFKRVGDFLKDTTGVVWSARHSDTTGWLCEVTFKQNYAVIWYHGQCQYDHFIYKTSDSTIELLWAYRPDCISDMSFLESSHGFTDSPKPNGWFAIYTLENDSTLRVDYKYPGWVKKVNFIAKDSLFPRRLYLQRPGGA
jgi:hypothetical protein